MKGIYVLLVSVNQNISVTVGALGMKNFTEGLYAYVGSAQINLKKRVKRHVRRVKPRFWHIDYLLSRRETKIKQIFYKQVGKPEECTVAKKLAEVGIPVKGFGSSDCSCMGHLLKIENHSFLNRFMHELGFKAFKEAA